MALIRPVVLVYQELATPTVSPTTPDLNCLVVGPAYYIQDYFQPGTTEYADKTSIQLGSVYGTLEGDPSTATPTGPGVITTPDAPNNLTGALVDDASVEVYFDLARARITSGTLGTTAALTPNQFDITDPGIDFTTGATKVLPGDRVIISDGTNILARTVYTVDSATRLHFTQDFPATGFTPGANQKWSIERQLNDQLIDSSFYTAVGNVITINGGVTLTVPTQGAKTVTYAKVYVQYRSLRQDLQEVDTVSSEDDIKAKIGRIDARNPLAVGVFVSLQNTTSTVQFYGVASNDLQGHTDCRDAIAARPDIYAIVPLLADTPTIAMWNTDCTGLALPDETRGRPQRFRVVIGSGTLPVNSTLITPQSTGQSVQLTGSAPTGITKVTAPGVDFVTAQVKPGDQLIITLDVNATSRNGTYKVAHVIDATNLLVDPSTPIPAAGTANASVEVKDSTGVTDKITVTTVTGLVSAVAQDLYLILQDANGSFITSGLMAGDIIQMPQNPTTNTFTGTLLSFVVASVLSENRVEIKNNGADSATVENELPYGYNWATDTLVPTTATLNYQVIRKLTKDQQVTNLVAVAQSFASKRTILVWPDKVDVAGVTGGTSQPGYYLSCAVGGMTAGLPPHQGFTFLGIAGISQIYDSNTYFTDSQLTDLSEGGWYVFAQQTPQALPFTIHQLTTDVSTLESGEFSVVKNFDFVSLFFVNILEEFLGIYNVTPEALLFLRAALNTGGTTLKQRTYAKIGAPLTSFQINDLGISPISADRVVTHVGIGLPKPLNVIELHLVA